MTDPSADWLLASYPPGQADRAFAAAAHWLTTSGETRAVVAVGQTGDVSPSREFVGDDDTLMHSSWSRIARLPGRRVVRADERAIADLPTASLLIVCPHADRADVLDRARALGVSISDLSVVADLDRFARPASADGAAFPSAPPQPARQAIELVVIGEREHLMHGYPALLGALGDAVDALPDCAIRVRIQSPRKLGTTAARGLIESADGLLLPGGVDPTQIAGQIRLARLALSAGVPTLGICFGMQSMTTAVLHERLGMADVALAEIAPWAARHSFVPLVRDGAGLHRLGRRDFRMADGNSMARAAYGRDIASARMNHRFRLDPAWIAPLADHGFRVSAWSCDGLAIPDIVEAVDHPFFVGIQGHPELGSRPGRPPALFSHWLAHCRTPSVTRRNAVPAPSSQPHRTSS